jgi:hypothetical protein
MGRQIASFPLAQSGPRLAIARQPDYFMTTRPND